MTSVQYDMIPLPSRLELQSYPKVIDIDVDLHDSKTDESKQCTFLYQALAFLGQKFGTQKFWPLLSSCPRNSKELLHYTEHRRDLSTLTFCIKAHSGFSRVWLRRQSLLKNPDIIVVFE